MEFIFAGLVIFLFYFILLRPVLNQQRQHRREISELDIGDEVLTTGGFFATVRELDRTRDGDPMIVLEASPGVLLRCTPAAVQSIVRHESDDESDDDRNATAASATTAWDDDVDEEGT